MADFLTINGPVLTPLIFPVVTPIGCLLRARFVYYVCVGDPADQATPSEAGCGSQKVEAVGLSLQRPRRAPPRGPRSPALLAFQFITADFVLLASGLARLLTFEALLASTAIGGAQMPRGQEVERQPWLFPVGDLGPPDGPAGSQLVACAGAHDDDEGAAKFQSAMAGLAASFRQGAT